MRACFAVGLVALGAACTGTVVQPTHRAEDPEPPPPGTVVDPSLCTPVAEAPVRRLSRAEYRATLAALFPDVTVDYELVSDPTEHGFENRAELLNPQPLLIEQYSEVAAEFAAAAIGDMPSWMPCDAASAGEAACARTFLEVIGERIFRRPLTAEELGRYEAFLLAERDMADFETGVQLTLEALLQSPQLLYRIEVGDAAAEPLVDGALRLTSFEVASRLSYLVWGTGPDQALLERARAGELETPEQREAEVRRMLDEPRARDMLVEFHRQWLDFDQIANEPKDATRYPSYDAALEAAAREESDRFVARVMWEGEGTVEALLTSRETEVNDALAGLYGVSAPPAGEWAPATLDGSERAGILTRAGFLAGRAHRLEGSPPLRGIFIWERLLCRTPPAPPADADLSEPAASGSGALTNRELFEERTSPGACRGCHARFDGLGFAFERYDAIGRHRDLDNGQPVDPTGTFDADGARWEIDDAVDLSAQLAQSPEVEACVTGHWYAYAAGRAGAVEDQCRVAAAYEAFEASGGDVRELLVAFATSPEFIHRPTYQVGR